MIFRIDSFEGINNVDDALRRTVATFGEDTVDLSGDLKSCVNFRVTKDKIAATRNGQTDFYTGTAPREYWANKAGTIALFVDGTSLYLLNTAGTGTLLYSGLTAGLRMNYAEHNNIIFMGNGIDMLKYDGSSVTKWGIDRPISGGSVSASGSQGRIVLGYTYVAANGNESGMSPLVTVSTSPGNTLTWTGLSTPSDSQVIKKRLYRSWINGEGLKLWAEIPYSQTSYAAVINERALPEYDNDTFDYRRPIPSNIILSYLGCVYVAYDRYVFPSEPGLPECFRETRHMVIGENVTALSHDGSVLYAHGYNTTTPFIGRDIDEFQQGEAIGIGAIKHGVIKPENVPYLLSRRGWAAAQGGQIQYLGFDKFRLNLPRTAQAYMGYDQTNREILARVKQ